MTVMLAQSLGAISNIHGRRVFWNQDPASNHNLVDTAVSDV